MCVLSVLLIQKARFQLHMQQASDNHHGGCSMETPRSDTPISQPTITQNIAGNTGSI